MFNFAHIGDYCDDLVNVLVTLGKCLDISLYAFKGLISLPSYSIILKILKNLRLSARAYIWADGNYGCYIGSHG